jgi:hypothetical protein
MNKYNEEDGKSDTQDSGEEGRRRKSLTSGVRGGFYTPAMAPDHLSAAILVGRRPPPN